MPDRTQSPAYLTLRPSARRLLAFVEGEIERQGGGRVTLYNDMFEQIGSLHVYLPGMRELRAVGLLEVERQPKRHLCALSDRWRQIGTSQAQALATAARKPPLRAWDVPQDVAQDVAGSPAYRALTPAARRALHLIEAAVARAGGPVRFTFNEFGVSRGAAIRAIRVLTNLDFVAAATGWGNRYTVTNGWRALDADEVKRRKWLPRSRTKPPAQVQAKPVKIEPPRAPQRQQPSLPRLQFLEAGDDR